MTQITNQNLKMKFVSFDQNEIQEEINRITDTVDEIKNMSENEKERKLISWDEIKKENNRQDNEL